MFPFHTKGIEARPIELKKLEIERNTERTIVTRTCVEDVRIGDSMFRKVRIGCVEIQRRIHRKFRRGRGRLIRANPCDLRLSALAPVLRQPDKSQDFEGSNRHDVCKGRLVGVACAAVWLGMTEMLQDSNAPLGEHLRLLFASR